jgi:hypothetical protein
MVTYILLAHFHAPTYFAFMTNYIYFLSLMLVPQKKIFQFFPDNYRISWVSHNYYKMVEYMYVYYANDTPLTQKGLRNLTQMATLPPGKCQESTVNCHNLLLLHLFHVIYYI